MNWERAHDRITENQLRLSEIRTKLSELGAVEGDLTPEQTAEIGTLRTEYQSCEVRSQALISRRAGGGRDDRGDAGRRGARV